MIQARMKNPALLVPGAMQALLAVGAVAKNSGVPARTLHLVYLRASQINGCSFCIDMHVQEAKKEGESDKRLWQVAGWRESPLFNPKERAALDLTEHATRMSDRSEAVPDDVYARARKEYSETELASLILNIGMINLWNRLNVTTQQPPTWPEIG